MNNFRVELNAIEVLFNVLCCSNGANLCVCSDLKSGSRFCNINRVAHPADCLGKNVLEELCACVNINVSVAVFSDGCGLNFAA